MRCRFIQLLVFPLFLSQAVAQSKQNKDTAFLLRGDLKGRDTGNIILWYPDTSGKWIRDTTYLQNGTFQFSSYVNEPSFCWLRGSTADGNTTSFFLEPGRQYISVEENKFEDFTMSG